MLPKDTKRYGWRKADEPMELSPVWISIVTSASAMGVSAESIYLGYLLFIAGATGAFKFSLHWGKGEVGLESVAPGIALTIFRAALAARYSKWLKMPLSQDVSTT
jgi:hypothetical protein